MNKGPTGKPTGRASELRKLCATDPDEARSAIMAALESVGGHRGKAALSLRNAGLLPPRGPFPGVDRAYANFCACVAALPGMADAIEVLWPGSSRGGYAWRTRGNSGAERPSEKIA